MDVSPPSLALKTEGHLDDVDENLKSNEVKNSGNSSARSSVISVKSTGGRKPNNLGGNNFSTKVGSKSQDNLAKKSIQNDVKTMAQSGKAVSNGAINSPRSVMENSKIPKRSPLNDLKIKAKPVISQKAKLLPHPPQPPKTIGEGKILPEKKRSHLNLKKTVGLPNSKSSLNMPESLQPKRMSSSSISRSSVANQIKANSSIARKCQSARSSSVTPIACANKRSVSNISSRNTCSSRSNSECEANLPKVTSIIGDNNMNKNKLNSDQKELLQKTNEDEENFKSSEVINEFKRQIEMYLNEWFSSLKNECLNTKETNALDVETMEQLQILQANEILNSFGNWYAAKNDNKENKLKKEIEEANKSIRMLEDLRKQHSKERLTFQKHLDEKAETHRIKIEEFQKQIQIQQNQVTTLKTTVENLEKENENLIAEKQQFEEDLKKSKECTAKINEKLSEAELESRSKSEIIINLEKELADKQKLELDFTEMTAKLKELQSKLEEQSHNECVEHIKQISELTNRISCLETDNETFHQHNEKLDLRDLQTVREKLMETENKLHNLQMEYEKCNKEITQENVPDSSKEVQVDLDKLRQSEMEKQHEIDKLKMELSKIQFTSSQQEKQIERDQRLLEVRSGLINSLQANEKTNHIQLEELLAKIGEKNNVINELNSELQMKSEELKDILPTMNARQFELLNQERIIKLLDESNERSQMLRVQQEEKISHMEEELTCLKQIIAIYQANALAQSNNGEMLFTPPALAANNMDYNENVYYYASQRRRKRQIDINVKKYEV